MYLIILPGILFFVVFRYVPMYGIQLAFKTFRASLGIAGSPWCGWENFEYLFLNKDFWYSVRNTLLISAYQVAFCFPFPVLLALLLNEIRAERYKKFVQTVYTLSLIHI